MITAVKIQEKYKKLQERDLAKLQRKCKHPTTTWCDQQWAPGHSTGMVVLVCDICGKILAERRREFR